MRLPETDAIVLLMALFFLLPLLFFLFFAPVLSCFRSCYSPVQRSRFFLRYFNGFSCNRRASAPCRSPVFFFRNFFHERADVTGAAGSTNGRQSQRRHDRASSLPCSFIVSIVLRIVSRLIPIVPAPASFLSPAQGLAL
jgi:hypothetical protein